MFCKPGLAFDDTVNGLLVSLSHLCYRLDRHLSYSRETLDDASLALRRGGMTQRWTKARSKLAHYKSQLIESTTRSCLKCVLLHKRKLSFCDLEHRGAHVGAARVLRKVRRLVGRGQDAAEHRIVAHSGVGEGTAELASA